MDVTQLPALNAFLNGMSAIFLSFGFAAIKNKKVFLHRLAMLAAFSASVLFLCSYLYYHAHVGHVRFNGSGWVRPVYLGILISHTILATAIVPLVLRTITLAIRNRFEDHRRWARWTWPLWMYVSITGVIIYWMLYHLADA